MQMGHPKSRYGQEAAAHNMQATCSAGSLQEAAMRAVVWMADSDANRNHSSVQVSNSTAMKIVKGISAIAAQVRRLFLNSDHTGAAARLFFASLEKH